MGDAKLAFACVVILAITAGALAALIRIAPILGLLDRPGGRKHHVGAVPRVGGLSVMVGLLAGALWFDGLGRFDRMLLATATALVVVGAIDDRYTLRVRTRVLVQAGAILTVILSTGVYIHHLGSIFGFEVNLGWFGVPFTMVALIGLLNAFNLVDGIDGLAISLSLVAISAILLIHHRPIEHDTGMLLALLVLALLPSFAANMGVFGQGGKCFLGDAGSTLLGYMLGWALIRFSQQPESLPSPVGTLWCVALPVMDTIAVMYRRVRQGNSPFKPDRGHLHYLLMDAGLPPRATLALMVSAAIALWLLGQVIRVLELGPGSKLIAFIALLAIYTYSTARLSGKLHSQARMDAAPDGSLAS